MEASQGSICQESGFGGGEWGVGQRSGLALDQGGHSLVLDLGLILGCRYLLLQWTEELKYAVVP